MTRIVVIGDVVLDRDLIGTVERLCPDAPVPVVDEQRVLDRAGGAGLAAVLAARDGSDVTFVTAVADDRAGRRLRDLLRDAGVELLACTTDGGTSEKVRIRVDGRSLLRLDRGGGGRIGPPPDALASIVGDADAVLVADYGLGMTAEPLARRAIAGAVDAGIPTVWDPHPRGTSPTPGVSLATPNRSEARHFDGRHMDGRHVERADGVPASGDGIGPDVLRARRLRDRWRVSALSVTLGEHGALVVANDGAPLMVPVRHPSATGDPCGAGDAFAAACATRLAAGAEVTAAVRSAVDAATEFVAAGGASGIPLVPGPTELAAPRPPRGILVATGGCFDVLHPGHVSTLEQARRLGDRLVVLLNSDPSVRRLKGDGRPVQRAADRAAVLRSLSCVDEVVVFDEDTPVEALRRLRPDVFVKGGDYSATRIAETDVLAEWGGAVVTVPFLPGRSTTSILERTGDINVV